MQNFCIHGGVLMNEKTGILEADPTCFGGIQAFVRTLASYLPEEKTELLAYYGDLAYDKDLPCKLVHLNDRDKKSVFFRIFGSRGNAYKSNSSIKKNLALLMDLLYIRCRINKLYPGGDTIVVNSASALLLFLSRKVLKNNRIVLVQHTTPRIMQQRNFDFGGFFCRYKIGLFRKYVDDFVMLSPFEKSEFDTWLPLRGKHCHIIRHSLEYPEFVPDKFPNAVAVLARLIPLKRIDRVIACAAMMPKVKFNIYGTGSEEEELKKSAINFPNVVFHGYTSDIDGVFHENTILAITSDYEGYPIGGIESCIHGRPIVAVNTFSAARDLVDNGINGILLEEYTPEKMAEAINTILKEPEKYQKGAFQHRERYNCEVAANKWRQLLLNEK